MKRKRKQKLKALIEAVSQDAQDIIIYVVFDANGKMHPAEDKPKNKQELSPRFHTLTR